MKQQNISSILSLVICNLLIVIPLISVCGAEIENQKHESFLRCLHSQNSSAGIAQVIYTPKNSSYTSTLLSSIQNLRFASSATPKPLVIITPLNDLHIQAAVNCSRTRDIQIRIRCGGHDYEGLSYVSKDPFIILDMRNLRSISIDTKRKTAWVEGGALVGEVYYRIAEKSPNLGFPAGICPTVGVGGHFGGGGFGTMLRKYGIAADNIIDARIINAEGEILDRKSMGEDVFWAIRAGGAASFGVILAWRIKLVSVPSTVTVFTVSRTLEQNATKLVYNWQSIAHKLDQRLFIRIFLQGQQRTSSTNRTVEAAFNSLFLGGRDKLMKLMQKSFSELGLVKEDCKEMSWIESVLYFNNFPSGSNASILLERNPLKGYYKAKSDYVHEPISEVALEGLWKRFYELQELDGGAQRAVVIFAPYGGKMDEISESEIPFPHRAGNLYDIQYLVYWDEKGNAESQRYINWMSRLYSYMAPFVSKFPARSAYYNYRDLDLGVNQLDGNTSYAQASIWGIKYFKNNFERLVRVKTTFDPSNFFRSEQSIPPKFSSS